MNSIDVEYMIEGKNINKHFAGVYALKDVNIALKKNSVHAVIGENGAGKSTLMNILFGLLEPDSGLIYRKGKEVKISSPIVAQNLGIGIVPQELNLIPELSVMENIMLGFQPTFGKGLLIDWKKTLNKAEAILEQIEEKINPLQRLESLSIAKRQLVQVARALAFGADILILDEPTASLTAKEASNLFRIINKLKSNGTSVFYISHRLEEIKDIADSATVLRDGEKITEIDPKKTSISEMVRYMVGRDVVETVNTRKFDYSRSKIILKVDGLSRDKEFSDVSFELFKGDLHSNSKCNTMAKK